MTTINQQILKDAEVHVSGLFQELPKGMTYHTLQHTKNVVAAVQTIGQAEHLSEKEMRLATLAAWFHDVGFVFTRQVPEEKSMDLVQTFLEGYDVPDEEIVLIREAIWATKMPQKPTTAIARVLCDADLSHFARPDYFDYIESLRQEQKWLEKSKISKLMFHKRSDVVFKGHVYHTDYGKTVLEPGKQKNHALIQEKIHSSRSDVKEMQKEIQRLNKALEKKKGYSRGVESMFRLTARNQISLSGIADNKSNLLISANTLIISIILTVVIGRFEENPTIILPTLMLLLTSLTTIVFAILSTRPNVSSGMFTQKDIAERKINLIFFGNFYNMTLDEYEWALQEMMKDDDYLYATMIKDQYSLGTVLAKKYKLLRKAYNFFMFGLIITVLTYVLAFTL